MSVSMSVSRGWGWEGPPQRIQVELSHWHHLLEGEAADGVRAILVRILGAVHGTFVRGFTPLPGFGPLAGRGPDRVSIESVGAPPT
jgi:hypothetical protein